MIVGENSRENDLNIDCTREKQLNNIRSAGADEKQILVPPIQMNLEKSLEYIGEDELVEITPSAIRIRKRELGKNKRSVVRTERDDA